VIEIDGQLSIDDMSLQAAWMLEANVWGQGFAQPIFYDNFKVISQRILKEKHLKLILQKDDSENNNKRFDAIYFNCIDELPENICAVYALEVNEYNGLQTLQLMIQHIEM
jgi:single-stranded-DNA-specific exonuclease